MSKARADQQKFEFKAEIQQLLHLLTHSLYTHRDIFVRELISNAADALDKARFKSVKGDTITDPDLAFEIRIDLDEEAKIFTIRDTGIGMTKEELIRNIGTIAHSGTSEFLKQMALEKEDSLNLIGKFGVGFYSVFMAGEKVEVTSQPALPGESAHTWVSDGLGAFEITPADKADRGTTVKVHLREEAKEFSEKWHVESIIKKYSNFVPFPIFLNGEQVNKITAIWREPKSSVKDEQYNEFYKFIAIDSDDPITRLHFSTDVPLQFNSLLFVPKANKEILGFGRDEEGIQLFVRRVLVDSHAKDILPPYLRFVRGVMDSDDLPLNISRETLQENPYLIKIKNTTVSKFLAHLQELAKNEPETYHAIWKEHGRILKEGYMDFTNKDKLLDLLRFNTSRCSDEKELISLQTYVERMTGNQEEIYYLSGGSRDVIAKSPTLEIFRSKEIEVLYCFDPVDEFTLSGLMEFQGKKFISADQVDLARLNKIESVTQEGEKEREKEDADSIKDLEKLARRVKDILGDKVEDVRLSARLVDSPAVLVGSNQGMSAQMQKILFHLNQETALPKRVMEINPRHPLVRNLLQIYQKDAHDPFLAKVVLRLFESVQWLDGYVTEPLATATGMQELLAEAAEMYLHK